MDRHECERSWDHPLVQSANLIVESLGDYSSLFVDIRHCGDIVGLDQYYVTEDLLLQIE